MRKVKLLALLLVATAMHASGVSAQACLGLPSFANGAIHLNVAGEFPDSATAYAVGVGVGKHNSLFGTLGGGQVTYEDPDGKTKFGFLEVGVQLPLRKAQVCPIAGGLIGSGPNDDAAGITVKSRSLTAGVALGMPIGLPFGGGAFKLIPNTAVRYDRQTQDVEDEFGSSRETSTTGIADFGLALVFRDRFSIQPLAHIFFGGDNEDTSFGVFASLSFGPTTR